MLLWFRGGYRGGRLGSAGNTFLFPVGAGNTCRDFSLMVVVPMFEAPRFGSSIPFGLC